MMSSEVESIDALYEICDAEFNSRFDVYQNFLSAKGEKSWARYYLRWEVQRVAERDGISCSWFMSMKIAEQISKDWFAEKKLIA